MKLKIPNYIWINLLLLLGFDALFLLNFDQYLLRSILAIYLVSFVPGLFFIKLFDSSKSLSTRLICYSVGFSLALVMVLGLVLNRVLLYYNTVHILDPPVLVVFLNSIIFILALINIYRVYQRISLFDFEIKNETLKLTDWIFLSVATLFPIISILGTSVLNNGGNGTIILVNLYLIALYIVLIVLKKPNAMVYPYSIYMIGLSILLNISLRSWLVSGSDILTEYRMFQSTLAHGYWSNKFEQHAYNICISITLLPSILARLTNINSHYIFKLVFQIFFAFVPVIVYEFTKKFTDRIWSYFAAILFISFPIYVSSLSMHIRQEIAFLFFALILFALFDAKLKKSSQAILLSIACISLVISHYSSTFIAITLFTLWYLADYVIHLALFIIAKWKKNSKYVRLYTHKVPLYFLLLLYISAFTWYAQITSLNNNLIKLKNQVIANLSDIHSTDVRVDQTSLSNQFNIFYKQKDNNKLLKELFARPEKPKDSKLYYTPESYKSYNPTIITISPLKINIPFPAYKAYLLVAEVIKKNQKILSLLGVAYLTLLFFRRKKIDKDYLIMSGVSLFILLAFMILPFFTLEYDILRTTQQLLVVLAFSTILGGVCLTQFLHHHIRMFLLTCFIVGYFLIYTDASAQVVGGTVPVTQLNNAGTGYERFTWYEVEKKSIEWLVTNKRRDYLIQTSPDSISKITASTLNKQNTNSSLNPADMYRNSYIYLNKVNVTKYISYRNFKGELLRYSLPTEFLEKNKDLIYSNKETKIYK